MLNVRRVVTANTEEGQSTIWRDGLHGNRFVGPREAIEYIDLWRTDGFVSGNGRSDDTGLREIVLGPPDAGSLFRIVQFPPDELWLPDWIKEQPHGVTPVSSGGHVDPKMHVTRTIDYIVVLEGEIWAVMETDETLLRRGDVLIQRGTWHAWHNRSKEPCTIACVMIDAGQR